MGSAVTSIQGRLLKIQMCVKYVFYFSKVRDCLICSTLEIKDLKIYELQLQMKCIIYSNGLNFVIIFAFKILLYVC